MYRPFQLQIDIIMYTSGDLVFYERSNGASVLATVVGESHGGPGFVQTPTGKKKPVVTQGTMEAFLAPRSPLVVAPQEDASPSVEINCEQSGSRHRQTRAEVLANPKRQHVEARPKLRTLE